MLIHGERGFEGRRILRRLIVNHPGSVTGKETTTDDSSYVCQSSPRGKTIQDLIRTPRAGAKKGGTWVESSPLGLTSSVGWKKVGWGETDSTLRKGEGQVLLRKREGVSGRPATNEKNRAWEKVLHSNELTSRLEDTRVPGKEHDSPGKKRNWKGEKEGGRVDFLLQGLVVNVKGTGLKKETGHNCARLVGKYVSEGRRGVNDSPDAGKIPKLNSC